MAGDGQSSLRSDLARTPGLHRRMREAAPEGAAHNSWDRVFESEVYAAYRFRLAMKTDTQAEGGPMAKDALTASARES